MPVLVNFGTTAWWLLWGTLYVQVSDAADLTAVRATWPTIATWHCDATQHATLLSATHTTIAGSLQLGGTVTVA